MVLQLNTNGCLQHIIHMQAHSLQLSISLMKNYPSVSPLLAYIFKVVLKEDVYNIKYIYYNYANILCKHTLTQFTIFHLELIKNKTTLLVLQYSMISMHEGC